MAELESTHFRACCICGGPVRAFQGSLTFPFAEIREQGATITPRFWHYTCATAEGYDLDVSSLHPRGARDLIAGKAWAPRVAWGDAA